MSGMFQRIARRHADGSDEPAAPEAADPAAATPGEPAPAANASGSDGHPADEAPASEASPTGDGSTAGGASADDAPTQRIEAVAPAPTVDQPTVFQPVAAATDQPTGSVPPPMVDLRARLAGEGNTPAAPTPPIGQPAPPADATAATVVAPAAAPAAAPAPVAAKPTAPVEAQPRRPGFRTRGRMRRRLRYLRRLRELQVRDLGGLVFDLRRFERKRDDLVAQKIDQIRACDDELRALELALGERRDLRDVREPGIGGTCPRCFAIHGSADKFCANCGAALGGAVQGPAILPLPPAPPPAAPEASGAGPEASGAGPER